MDRLVFWICCLLISMATLAQKGKELNELMPTGNLDEKERTNRSSNEPDRKNYMLFYKTSAKNTLYGNPCATAATHKMGFEYIVEPKGAGSKTSLGKFLNNLGVKSKLFVTRSPFWKIILNSRMKKCRAKSGDIIG